MIDAHMPALPSPKPMMDDVGESQMQGLRIVPTLSGSGRLATGCDDCPQASFRDDTAAFTLLDRSHSWLHNPRRHHHHSSEI
jgi:hypothetical protein